MPAYDNGYIETIGSVTQQGFTGAEVWFIVSALLAVIGGIFVYFAFVREKEHNFKGFLQQVHRFLNFKLTIFEGILKIVYLVGALTLTLSSFALIGSNFIKFLVVLVFGNIALRIAFEVTLKLFILCKEVGEINTKLDDKPKPPKPKKDEEK